MLWDGAQMATFWRFFACCIFGEPRAARSDLHSKFTLWPHHVWKYGRYAISDRWHREEKMKEETTGWKYIWKYISPALLHRAAINNKPVANWPKFHIYNHRCWSATMGTWQRAWGTELSSGVQEQSPERGLTKSPKSKLKLLTGIVNRPIKVKYAFSELVIDANGIKTTSLYSSK